LDGILADGPEVVLVDVRNPGEVAIGMIPQARNIPLAQLARHVDELPRDRPVVLNCAGGWRSSVAASYLRAHGFTDVSDLLGGYDAWIARQNYVRAAAAD
jgi:rhodanese-related sulfurtransferase